MSIVSEGLTGTTLLPKGPCERLGAPMKTSQPDAKHQGYSKAC